VFYIYIYIYIYTKIRFLNAADAHQLGLSLDSANRAVITADSTHNHTSSGGIGDSQSHHDHQSNPHGKASGGKKSVNTASGASQSQKVPIHRLLSGKIPLRGEVGVYNPNTQEDLNALIPAKQAGAGDKSKEGTAAGERPPPHHLQGITRTLTTPLIALVTLLTLLTHPMQRYG